MTATRTAKTRRPSAVLLVGGGIALVGAVWGIVAWRSRSVEPPSGFPGIALAETAATEPPPDFAVPATEALRLELLIAMLMSADQDDALWARDRLLEAGPDARRMIAEIAERQLQSNTAFVQNALDVLLADPRLSDARLAIEGLQSFDPHVATRSCDILASLRDGAPPDAIAALATAARRGYPIPQHACSALAAIGGSQADAALAAIALDDHEDPTPRQQALVALGSMREVASLAALKKVFDTAVDPQVKVAAAQGLVDRKDPHPIAWLHAEFDKSRSEQSLTLLSWAADDKAFAEIESRLLGTLQTERDRTAALQLLERFSPERKLPLLRRLVTENAEGDVLWNALEELAKVGGPDAEQDLLRLLTPNSDPERAKISRYAAALVLGRLKDPRHADAIVAALPANGVDDNARTVLLRAVVLSGAADHAEVIVKEMATDPSGFDVAGGASLNLWTAMGSAKREFRKAAAPFVLKALRGEYGPAGPRARADLIRMAGLCCGPEAAPLVEPFLTDPKREYREAAVTVLPGIAGPTTLRALRAAWWAPQDAFTRAGLRTALERLALVKPTR